MSLYSKYLIIVASVGLVCIPVIFLDVSSLGWQSNKEIYWGMIALIALIGTVLFDNTAREIEKKIKKKENKEVDIQNNQ